MANRIVSVHAGIYGIGIYAIMLPSSGFSVAHWKKFAPIILARSYPSHCSTFRSNFPEKLPPIT